MKIHWITALAASGLALSGLVSAQGDNSGATADQSRTGTMDRTGTSNTEVSDQNKPVKKKRHLFGSRKAAKLSKEFGVSEDEVQALRDRGMGWSDVRRSLSISQKSGKPASEIADLRDSGMSWNDISQRYGLTESSTSSEQRAAGGSPSSSMGSSQGGEVPGSSVSPSPSGVETSSETVPSSTPKTY
jgi:hypothetical protein